MEQHSTIRITDRSHIFVKIMAYMAFIKPERLLIWEQKEII
jgi:hypothetical protein